MEELKLQIVSKEAGYLWASKIWGPDKGSQSVYVLCGTLVFDFVYVHSSWITKRK